MDDRRPEVFGVTLAMFIFATVVVILRFISCIAIVRKVAMHDYLMLVAWILAFGFCFSICYGTTRGFGLHEEHLEPENLGKLLRCEYVITVLYNPAIMAVKTSILVFYFTLTGREKVYLWANYLTIALINGAGLALTFLNLFQCRPYRATFIYPVPEEAKCIDIVTLYLSSAPVNIITDLVILFLPLPILTAMTLPRKQKIILIVTFGFGVFAIAVGIVRVAYLQNASVVRMDDRGTGKNYGPNDALAETDYSWYASLSFMWSAVEVNAGIICACIPNLKPLVNRVLPRMIKDTSDQGTVPPVEVNIRDPAPPTVPHGEEATAPVRRQEPDPTIDRQITMSREINNADEERQPASPIDFPTAPDQGQRQQWGSTASGASNLADGEAPRYYDFVNIKTPENMLKMTNRESIFPNAMATIIFFLWGFAYGLLSSLNAGFEDIVQTNPVQTLGLRAAYLGAYLIGPLTIGLQVLKYRSFRGCFVVGLFLYGAGTFVFWPSAVLFSFSALIISNFLVGLGISVLETAANPFIVMCGPMENAEVRLNISQGFQAVGGVVSPLLAIKVFFNNIDTPRSLISAQWAYLGIAFFVVLLGITFYYLPLPDASEKDLKELADRRRADNYTKICGIPAVWVTLGLGVFAQACYIGGQEIFYIRFQTFVESLNLGTTTSPFDYELVGHSLFAIGRFLTALVQYFIKPRWVLLVLYIGVITASALAMNLRGKAGLSMALLIFLLEGGIFSSIFATSLRGTGRHTKRAGAIMTASISGGAMFIYIHYYVETARGIAYSLCVIIALFAASAVFALYLNFTRTAQRQVDPVPGENLRRRHRTHTQHAPGRACLVTRSSEPSHDHEGNGSVFPLKESFDRLRNKLRKQSRRGSSQEKSDNSGSSGSSRYSPTRAAAAAGARGGGVEGGIMHDLAPWTSSTDPHPPSGNSSTPTVSGGRE